MTDTVHNFPFTVGDAMRRARIDAGLSPQDVAGALGLNYNTILRWESGAKIPGGKNLARFIRVTGAHWLPDALEDLGNASSRCYVDLAGHELAEELDLCLTAA